MIKIAIVANFCDALDGSKLGRFIYLAEMLSDTGRYDVELITSNFIHLSKEHRKFEDSSLYKSKITLCQEPGYVSHKGLNRLLSHRKWGKAVVKHIKSRERPDIIYCAIPSLTAAHDLALYCKKHNIKFVIDIQDLWPEAIFMLADNPLIRAITWPMKKFVDIAYKNADAIIAVSDTYANRAKIVNKKNAKTLPVFLGNDGGRFKLAARDLVITRSEALTIGYIGTISYSYDIACVIDSIKILNETGKYPHIKFLVMGDGPLKSQFTQYASMQNVDCEFTGMLMYEDMVKRLCNCDILVNPIVKGAAQSITNKVGDYALSGKPVINTQESPEYRCLIDSYGCGINCMPGDPNDVAKSIGYLINNPDLRKRMGEKSLLLGLQKFDRRKTYLEIVHLLDEISNQI